MSYSLPTPTNAQLREAFEVDGLSITDSSLNEWVEMQETVAHLIFDALDATRPTDVTWASRDDLVDAVYAKADEIVTTIDRRGGLVVDNSTEAVEARRNMLEGFGWGVTR